MSGTRKKTKGNRYYLLAVLLVVWAVVLINAFGGGSSPASAEVVVPLVPNVAVSTESPEKEINPFIAPQEIVEKQQLARAIVVVRNPMGSRRIESVVSRESGYRLSSITKITDNVAMAIINGKPFKAGDIVTGIQAMVLGVDDDRIRIELNGKIKEVLLGEILD